MSLRPAAVEAGAAALVVERELELDVAQVVVADARAAMAPLAARFWGDPTAELRVVGVTGTNGKTTTAFLLREILEAAGIQCGLLGTVQAGGRRGRGGGRADHAGGDRPAGDLPADARGRRPGLRDGGLLARAGAAPRRRDPLRGGAVHQPDPGPPRLPRRHGGLLPRQAAALRDGARDGDRQRRRPLRAPPGRGIRVRDLLRRGRRGRLHAPATSPSTPAAPSFDASMRPVGGRSRCGPGCPGTSTSPTRWAPSPRRAALGVDAETAAAGLARAARVPGRFEPIDEGQGFAVLVDYAHTPDSLENVLRAARRLTEGRLISVFGAGGDRDRDKRPKMGRAGGRALRPGDRHLRQPALRGPGGDHRRGRSPGSRTAPGSRSSPTAARRSRWPSGGPSPATPS